MWTQTRIAVNFFHEYLPFWEMQPADDLVSTDGAYCFSKPGEIYTIYLPKATTADIQLDEAGTYTVHWFDPKQGGDLQNGSVAEVNGGGNISIGKAPSEDVQDWVVLLQKH